MKAKTKLIGSAPTLEMLSQLLKDRWYWGIVRFEPQDDSTWTVYSGNGLSEGLIVKKKGKRFRLEMRS